MDITVGFIEHYGMEVMLGKGSASVKAPSRKVGGKKETESR